MGYNNDLILVATSAIFMYPINLIGLSYVYYRVITHYRKHGSLPPNLKLPFYVAIIDTFLCNIFGVELIHSLVAGELWSDSVCFGFGFATSYCIIANFILISQSSLFTYLRVRFKKQIDYGKYEYKLLAPTIIVPGIFCGVYAMLNSFGGDRYLCFIRPEKPIQAAIIVTLVLLSIIQISFCYISVVVILYKTIRASNEASFGSGASTNNSISLRERQVIWKVSMYILACLIQYIPGCPFPISYMITSDKPLWIYILAVITIQTGGMINAITLLVNEGFGKRLSQMTKDSLDSRSFGKHNTHSINGSGSSSMNSFTYEPDNFIHPSTSSDWSAIMAARSTPMGISDNYTWEYYNRTHTENERGAGV